MKFRKEHTILIILLILSLILIGCTAQSSNSDEDPYIAAIKNWSLENLEQEDNYTMLVSAVNFFVDENGNELTHNEYQYETIVYFDPYKTKQTDLSDTENSQPQYVVHQNGEIVQYAYDSLNEKYLVYSTSKEDLPEEYQSSFDIQYIGEGERLPGILNGMIDYEIIEETDDQYIIKANIDSKYTYGELVEDDLYLEFTKTVYYDKVNQRVERVETHVIQNQEALSPGMEVDGQSVKALDITIIKEYKDINSSPNFDLPEDSELSY